MEIGGFRPSTEPTASWFGRVNLAAQGEGWPTMDEKPMHALCQINLKECPWRPTRLDDLEFMTVFVGPEHLPTDGVNGINWCLRAYRSIGSLVPISAPDTGSTIRAVGMRPAMIEADYPCYDDIVDSLPDELIDEFDYDEFDDLFENVSGFKLGGWPSLIQSEIQWSKQEISPEYVLQIPTTEKANWMWGDNGVGYFGRGATDDSSNEWTLEWQCY
jgi:uncharacterized protein YwqG